MNPAVPGRDGPAVEHRESFDRRIDEVFALVADLRPEERAAALERECGGDVRLRGEVESLLANDGQGSALIQELVGREAAALEADMERAVIGRRFGPWKAVAILGRGGMGAIYEVSRDDGAFEQRAALKIIRAEVDDERSRRRFRVERQILAQLNHPNIARLLDGGTGEDGALYLVMEAVDGLPITEYCDRHHLTVDQRLRLFLTVCRAVQAAHWKRTIHRDLKPTNILVTADGTVKLLDFGIAGLIEPGASAAAPPSSGLAFTPGYASPEQRRGEQVTTAADIYSLGVVLFEMLTGDRIGDQYMSGVGPSTSAPPSLARRLRDDVDAIVIKALRRDPVLRYGSAAELAADIYDHLAGAPVVARPPSRRYRVMKFARRHRLLLGAAAAVALTIAAAVGFSVWQTRRTERRLQLELVGSQLLSAEILASSGRATEAEEQATEGLTRALRYGAPPDRVAELYAVRGGARLAMGDLAGAAADADACRSQPSSSASCYELAGKVAFRRGDAAEGRKWLDAAEELRREEATRRFLEGR